MHIVVDDLSGPQIQALVSQHLANMHQISPPESVHALPLEGLRSPEITLWSVWDRGELLGCGALKELHAHAGEIKAMRTHPVHRRKGVGRAMLEHIVSVAESRGYRQLFLETGSQPEFKPAVALYARHGFVQSGPFGDYQPDPNSTFMVRQLR